MMNRKTIALLAFGLLLASGSAFAAAGDAGSWEISAAPGINYQHNFGDSITAQFARNQVSVGTNGGIATQLGYNLGGGLEAVASPEYTHIFGSSGSFTSDSLRLLVGANYSIMPEMKNSIFVEGLMGIDLEHVSQASVSDTKTNLTWLAGVGKRFALNDFVTFRPEIAYTWTKQSGSNLGSLAVVPVVFSFFF